MTARDPILREDGVEFTSYRVREHTTEWEPAPGPETRGGLGAYSAGG
jgi:hypothetical protein